MIYCKEIERVINNRCAICNESFPTIFEAFKGKNGCSHYEDWIKQNDLDDMIM